jgi:signal transduction histidine kinase
MTVTGRPRPLAPSVIPVAVRIVEEGLTNIVKHAGAASAWLTVAYDKRVVRITLADNGSGFNVGGSREGHWGLVGMHERASEIAAQLHIRSTADHGTEVILEIPLRRRSD